MKPLASRLTPAEFEKLTKVSLTLGRTLGLTGTQSIEQFTTALGRRSLLILDNFGISARQVNAEVEKLAQVRFGKVNESLSKAQKDAVFMEAALKIASESAAAIGEDASLAAASFDRMTAAAGNFQSELGQAVSDLNQATGFTEAITREINQATDALRVFRGGTAGATIDQQIEATELKIRDLEQTFKDTTESIEGTSDRLDLSKLFGLGDIFDEKAIESQEQALKGLNIELNALKLDKIREEGDEVNETLAETAPIVEENIEALKAYEQALKSAEQLQLSFARSAEDSALKLARANEDIARKQGRQVNRLQEKQSKDREKILDDQIKERENFEKDGLKEVANAEKEVAKERAKADESRLKSQKKLQDKLRQQEDRFNLSQLQGSRRFALAERRLRAEGDILALQELREDRELTLQEEKENFNQQQNQTNKSGKEQINEQEKVSNDRINEVKDRIEQERAELLAGFDAELSDFQQQQIAERANLQARFAEQAEDRKIALERQEEDRRISQARQLEDLGRSLAEQEGVTKEGSEKVALALEEVFGIDGTASNIMSGFTAKTESEFRDLFDNLNEIVTSEGDILDLSNVGLPSAGPGRNRRSSAGLPSFEHGGEVGGPGPIGSPQLVVAHKGERFLGANQSQQDFAMTAPVTPAQVVDVNMSGGFNITGDGQGNEEVIQAATVEMVENFRIAIDRLARRN